MFARAVSGTTINEIYDPMLNKPSRRIYQKR